MFNEFSVLLSIYSKEHVAYARQCFESLLNQTTPANEWVIVEDGPLTEELYTLLDEYENKFPNLIKRVPLKENMGLGLALREGIQHCSYELVARMDTDDIAVQNRFEKQLRVFQEHSEIDICGGQIEEFEDTPEVIVASRHVPLDDAAIKQYQKQRDAFNHVTVMFKKTAVLRAGNYQSAPLMEDTLLWCNMILAGATCMNLDETLVWVRIGKNMYERRGGWSYFLKYRQGRKMVRKTGYISWWDYVSSLAAQLVVALLPGNVRGFVFKRLLHPQ